MNESKGKLWQRLSRWWGGSGRAASQRGLTGAAAKARDLRDSDTGKKAAARLSDLRDSDTARKAGAKLADLRETDAARKAEARLADLRQNESVKKAEEGARKALRDLFSGDKSGSARSSS